VVVSLLKLRIMRPFIYHCMSCYCHVADNILIFHLIWYYYEIKNIKFYYIGYLFSRLEITSSYIIY
jgi:hypothetical protein